MLIKRDKTIILLKEGILNNKIQYIGRSASLCRIGIGNMIKRFDTKNKKCNVAEFSFHIDCSFRISKDGKIKITNLDMFEPVDELSNVNNFNWDVYGNNLFDLNVTKLNDFFRENEVVVKSIMLTEQNDLTLNLSSGWRIETFNNCCTDSENWRFFKVESDEPHIIACRNYIEQI